MMARSSFLLIALLALVANTFAQERARVQRVRVPNDGVQPYARIDRDGTVHLVYARGTRDRGDLYYVRREANSPAAWTRPVRVNSEDGSAKIYGVITRAHMDVGKGGRVHVVWVRMGDGAYFYARTKEDRSGFEEQRNLLTKPVEGIEAGPTVAAFGDDVIVAWHAGDFALEEERAVFLARSRDGGASFGAETPIETDVEGVCACCALQARFGARGDLYITYRAAGGGVHRGMTLLRSSDGGERFEAANLHAWELPACPVTTTSLETAPAGPTFAAWETMGQVYFARVSPELGAAIAAPGAAIDRRKNPTLAVNSTGEVLLVWSDGPGFRSGGTLSWQLYDARGATLATAGRAKDPVPDSSLPTAVATPDGDFIIVY